MCVFLSEWDSALCLYFISSSVCCLWSVFLVLYCKLFVYMLCKLPFLETFSALFIKLHDIHLYVKDRLFKCDIIIQMKTYHIQFTMTYVYTCRSYIFQGYTLLNVMWKQQWSVTHLRPAECCLVKVCRGTG